MSLNNDKQAQSLRTVRGKKREVKAGGGRNKTKQTGLSKTVTGTLTVVGALAAGE